MENIENRSFKSIIKGVFFSLSITLICIFIFSIILTVTNISEKIIPIIIIFISFLSIFIGTIISIKKINKNGMLNGGIIGAMYVILLYILSSIISANFGMNMYTIIMMIFGIVSGVIGGIIGINL